MRDLIKDADKRHKGFASQYGKGLVTLMECKVCGYLEWHSTREAGPDDVIVIGMEYCNRCQQVARRNPEVYEWVLSVAAMVLIQSAPAASDSGDEANG